MRCIETHVAVIGAGAAGCITAGALATFAPRCDITLIESDCNAHCNSTIASAFIPAAGTRFQNEQGIIDTPQAMAEDIYLKNKGESDYDLTLAMCSYSANVIHWMTDVAGVPIEFADEINWFGHNTPRMHSHKLRSGTPIIRQLHTFLKSLDNVDVLDLTTAQRISYESNARFRLSAISDGYPLEISSQYLVFATGGFGGNPDMIKQYIPDMSDAWHIGAATNQGMGIRSGISLGGQTKLMGGFQGRDTIREDGTRVTPGVISEGGIAVNSDGLRFIREDLGYSPLSAIFRAQKTQFVFLVWDKRIQEQIADLHIMVDAAAKGEIYSFYEPKELSDFLDFPEGQFLDTLETYNATNIGVVDEFGRIRSTPQLTAPFYACRVTGSIAHTQGGLTINQHSQVIDQTGYPIKHLYAVGNDAAGLSGGGSDGYLSGNGWFLAITSGFAAAHTIASNF